MVTCNFRVSKLLLFAVFLPVDIEEGDLFAALASTGAGGGVRGNGVNVTAGWFWTAHLSSLSVSGELSGFQFLEGVLAASWDEIASP